MQKSIISWTNQTWNPTAGCSKVSDGCKNCYAATLSQKFGWTTKPWTIQNEEENVVMKPHKLKEPYLLKEPSRVFVNSMSDLFHRVIPDWYRAVVFCVMLDLEQHVFQVLTKRPTLTVDWHKKFAQAIQSEEFKQFAAEVKDKRVKAALSKPWASPWGENIWMGTSVEDARVLDRIGALKLSYAKVKFISAEPLLGPFGKVDFTGIHWVIVGGESGAHLTSADNPRWMKQEWAREIKNQCVEQKVAFFMKQDSGIRTELRTYLVEEDGSKWKWEQYPGDLKPPVALDKNGKIIEAAKPYTAYETPLPDNDMPWVEFVPPIQTRNPEPPAPKPTRVVNFQDVKLHWDFRKRQWDSPEYVYIGRANSAYNLPESEWSNPYRIQKDTPEARAAVIEKYRADITFRLKHRQIFRGSLESLRGKTLVCWCSPKACHGDVLLELLGEKPAEPEQPKVEKPVENEVLQQLSLFS